MPISFIEMSKVGHTSGQLRSKVNGGYSQLINNNRERAATAPGLLRHFKTGPYRSNFQK